MHGCNTLRSDRRFPIHMVVLIYDMCPQEGTGETDAPVQQAVPYLSGVTGGLKGAAALGSYAVRPFRA